MTIRQRNEVNLISISGGKDSTAMMLLAYERGVDAQIVFADTGHEHPETYSYVEYLNDWCHTNWDRTIQVVKADFADKFEARRANIEKLWSQDGIPRERIDRAIAAMAPSGNPFLDLCKLKGRFPSTMARFCTVELKHNPINALVDELLKLERAVISWQGIRAEESPARANLPEKDVEFGRWDPIPEGFLIYRPLIRWTVQEVFAQHHKHGVKWNPLYEKGMARVGCMPCIMARKGEISEIASRFPAQVDRLERWEKDVSDCAKRGGASFFATDKTPDGRTLKGEELKGRSIGIREVVEWAAGSNDPSQVKLFEDNDQIPSCSSIYGLCE